MCDCISIALEKVKERVVKDKTNGYKVQHIDFEHHSWYPETRLYSNVIMKTTFIKKDGSESKPINEHVSLFYTYCPFCGEKLTEQKTL